MSISSVDSLADTSFEEVSIEMRRRDEEHPLLKNRSPKSSEEHVPRRAPVGALPRVDEADDEDDEDPILEVMDFIEDEVDGNLYDELVPLHVKLALEENVFGWSHLVSDIFGHIMFTAGYYFVTFFIVTQVCWKRSSENEYELRWNMSVELFRTLRFLLSFMAGVSGFRTVRRRRKVWLRAPYGTQEYEKDEQRRRLSVEESDRTTLLGRIRRSRDGWLERRVQRKISKASGRFEKRIRRKMRQAVRVLRPRKDAEYEYSGVMSDGEVSFTSLIKKKKKRKKKRRFRTDHPLGLDLPHGRTIVSGHTGPTENIESIAHDQILFKPGPIHNMPYAHGGFFGAAPFMLANPYWINILRHLMPDVYVEISRRVVHAPASKLIHWAENNPVVAAFGTAHELEYNGRVPNIEWDVFLDPHLVQRVEVVLDEREKFLRSCARGSLGENDEVESDQAFANEAAAAMTPGQRTILRYYDAEIRRRSQVLVDRMLIAHGNLTQLIWEQTGFAKKYNFSRIKRTRRTLGGGIFARQWLSLYAEALKMGMCDDSDDDDVDTKEEDENRGLYWTSSESSVESTAGSSDDELESELEQDSDAARVTKSFLQTSGCSSSENNDFGDTAGPLKRSSSEPSLAALGPMQGSKDLDNPRETDSGGDRLPRRSLFEDPGEVESHTAPVNVRKSIFRKKNTSLHALAWSKCPDFSMTRSISMLKSITQCNAPVGLFLDIKSRHVPKRVWALVVDSLREAGVRVEGVASFIFDDVRGVSRYCSTPVKEVIFFHSAGDMQQACHDGRVQRGDTVAFNGGSLLWESPNYSKVEAVREFLRHCWSSFDPLIVKGNYKFLPFARISGGEDGGSPKQLAHSSSTGIEREMDGRVSSQNRDSFYDNAELREAGSTIQHYKETFELSIGMYCQEFAIDEAAANMLVKLVNDNPHVYDLGFSWGGVNGVTVRDIQPGRFTNTDGFWNQRYGGASWDSSLFPQDRRE